MKYRRYFICSIISILCVFYSLGLKVKAQYITFDPTNFMANYGSLGKAIQEVMKMVEQINNQRVQIMNQIEQIRYMDINTRNFDYMIKLKQMMGEIDKSVNDTLGGVNDLESLHNYFEAMYPDLRSMDPHKVNELNIDGLHKKQYQASRNAIEAAMKAQTTADQITIDQDENTRLLSLNKKVEGQKQAIQITNEYLAMLGNKIDRLTDIITSQYKSDSIFFQNEIQKQEVNRIKSKNLVGDSKKWIEEQRKKAGPQTTGDSKKWRMGGGLVPE